MTIPYYTNKALIETLIKNNILLMDYKPAYGGESAALDLYYTGTEELILPPAIPPTTPVAPFTTLQKNQQNQFRILIPTGLHLALPPNHAALIRERGSVTKTPLTLRAGVVDPGYTGEIFVNMVNLSDRDYILKPQSKLPVQILITPVITDFSPITQAEYEKLAETAKRKTAMIGSTN